MKNILLTDELREEMRLRPDRRDRYETVLAMGEVMKNGEHADIRGYTERTEGGH